VRARRQRVSWPRPVTRRGGYTLMESIVTVAILVVIAAVMLPVLSAGGASDRLNEAESELKGLTDAVAAFFHDVTEWPGDVGDLVNPIGGGDQDVCGRGYSGGERNGWAGPYLTVAIPAGGLDVGIGTVRSDFIRLVEAPYTLLGIVVDNVEVGDAVALDEMVDADGDPNAGTIRWTTPPVGGQVTLTWYIPITPC
jgi:prepilin-type N-terminal cleavage/methylation domain-containing protein